MRDGRSDIDSGDLSESFDWEAAARHLAGESSPEEDARMDSILSGHPEEQRMIAELDRITSEIRSEVPPGLDVEAALARVKSHPEFADPHVLPFRLDRREEDEKPVRRWRISMPALAAAALLAVGVASWMAYDNRPREQAATANEPRMLATGVGVRDSMVLSDGTRVLIGPLSAVKVASSYGTSSREVEVRGDAWFDVVHDESRPFTVHAGDASITDVGTKFTVQSDEATGVSVSVSEGAVSLRQVNTPPQQGVILKAGDNGVMKSGGIVTRRGTVNDDDFAWMRGRLVFREASLGEVVSSMRKWYGIEMKVQDRSLLNQHLTATFANESPDRVLEVIRLALGVDIERRGDTAIVGSAKGSMRSR